MSIDRGLDIMIAKGEMNQAALERIRKAQDGFSVPAGLPGGGGGRNAFVVPVGGLEGLRGLMGRK